MKRLNRELPKERSLRKGRKKKKSGRETRRIVSKRRCKKRLKLSGRPSEKWRTNA